MRRRRPNRMPGICAAALLLAVASGPGAAPAAADITLTLAVPASGPGAEKGRAMRLGAERAVAGLNAAGGLHGSAIRLRIEADDCAAAPATETARSIAAAQPALILGHPCAPAAHAAAKVYGPARLLFMATATRHPGLTAPRAGPTVFRLDGRDDRQGEFAAAELLRLAGGGPIALVSDRTAYARRIVGAARTALAGATGREPLILTLVAGDKDFSAQVADITRGGAKAVLFAGFPLEAALLLRQMRAAGATVAFIGSDATATREFVQTAGAAAAGATLIMPLEISEPAARTEAAIQAWAAAAGRAGSVQPLAVATELQRSGAGTVIGPVQFSAGGDALLASFRLVDALSFAASGAPEAAAPPRR